MIQFSGNRHPSWSLEERSTWCFLLFTPDSLDRILKFSHPCPVDKGRHVSRLGAPAVCSLGLLRSREDGSWQRHSWVLNQSCLDVKTFPDKQKQPSHQIPPWPLYLEAIVSGTGSAVETGVPFWMGLIQKKRKSDGDKTTAIFLT